VLYVIGVYSTPFGHRSSTKSSEPTARGDRERQADEHGQLPPDRRYEGLKVCREDPVRRAIIPCSSADFGACLSARVGASRSSYGLRHLSAFIAIKEHFRRVRYQRTNHDW
jgi:hypothetical protein